MTASAHDGFYVRQSLDGEPDWLAAPVYEIRSGRARVIAGRFGSADWEWEQGERPFPPTLVRAGDTAKAAIEFARAFYAGGA